MKKVVFILFFLLFLGVLFAQKDAKITTGVVAYETGDYLKAEALLREGLVDENQLKEKNAVKGWYYLGKSLVGVISLASQNNDSELLHKYEGGLLESYNCFRNCFEQSEENIYYQKLAKDELNQFYSAMLSGGLQYLNARMFNEAKPYFDAAVYINQNALEYKDYLAFDLRGQNYLAQNDSVLSQSDLIKAAEIYEQNPPTSPDLLIGYVYYRLAFLKTYMDRDLDMALEYLQVGLESVENEYKRLLKSNYSNENWKILEEQYSNAINDLFSFQLELLLNSPKKLNLALEKFAEATEKEPKNYMRHIAYAQLLENVDLFKAVNCYEKAISIDASKFIGYYNLGALYINEGVSFLEKMNKAAEQKEVEINKIESTKFFKLALPVLEKAHQLDPLDIATLDALLQLTGQLDLIDKYEKYKKVKNNLNY